MNLPITARAQYSTQNGLKSTQPIIGGDCGCEPPCDCGSPSKLTKEGKSKLLASPKVKGAFRDAIESSPATKKNCGY
tara:strand:- start:227 stop:457 length:231 start_codon:yes stop_codon:yes gene_type:complete